MKKFGKGTIVNLNNNYGVIQTGSFNKDGEVEEFPFQVTSDMIVEKDGIQYIKYSNDVSFELDSLNGIRREGRSFEIKNIQLESNELFFKREFPKESYVSKVINKFKEFNFDTSELDQLNDVEKYEYLKRMGFQPRMLNYLTEGIFLKTRTLEVILQVNENINDYTLSNDELIDSLKLSPRLIVVVDKVDQKFRSYLMEWVLQIENSIKSYLGRIATDQNAAIIVEESLNLWITKKGESHIKRARKEKLFRHSSDSFDYVCNPLCPIEDFLDQLDLSELKEFLGYWYEKSQGRFISVQLEMINSSLNFFRELSLLRNSSAHGRPILAAFMDPDYNPNWDLEFDYTTSRTKIEEWTLYPILYKNWENRGLSSEMIPGVIQTIYGNSYRKAWVTLNYLYSQLISVLDEDIFNKFRHEAEYFLNYPTSIEEHYKELGNVNILQLKLSDMGMTTLEPATGVPAPYKEIAQEAWSVW
ncbi:Abi family protein [Streptococcus sanguinis]|jgi:hypothetical protein|uniref:Abi family protein n=1 Tax=Streptococcus sanguinis TaxID=1305 RepID=UPI001374C12F|nr:Abi family protein [Streptococcus sanguinis]KAF1306593.1 hypothetical protein I925_10077 [Streptococcus sanguinis OH0843]